ncbi:unnamed protein product [Caenorhabditis bovis]|nr:unnamed protein product [Caenorhabditis bovis]
MFHFIEHRRALILVDCETKRFYVYTFCRCCVCYGVLDFDMLHPIPFPRLVSRFIPTELGWKKRNKGRVFVTVERFQDNKKEEEQYDVKFWDETKFCTDTEFIKELRFAQRFEYLGAGPILNLKVSCSMHALHEVGGGMFLKDGGITCFVPFCKVCIRKDYIRQARLSIWPASLMELVRRHYPFKHDADPDMDIWFTRMLTRAKWAEKYNKMK